MHVFCMHQQQTWKMNHYIENKNWMDPTFLIQNCMRINVKDCSKYNEEHKVGVMLSSIAL
jgi:hypothetical protein